MHFIIFFSFLCSNDEDADKITDITEEDESETEEQTSVRQVWPSIPPQNVSGVSAVSGTSGISGTSGVSGTSKVSATSGGTIASKISGSSSISIRGQILPSPASTSALIVSPETLSRHTPSPSKEEHFEVTGVVKSISTEFRERLEMDRRDE